MIFCVPRWIDGTYKSWKVPSPYCWFSAFWRDPKSGFPIQSGNWTSDGWRCAWSVESGAGGVLAQDLHNSNTEVCWFSALNLWNFRKRVVYLASAQIAFAPPPLLSYGHFEENDRKKVCHKPCRPLHQIDNPFFSKRGLLNCLFGSRSGWMLILILVKLINQQSLDWLRLYAASAPQSLPDL